MLANIIQPENIKDLCSHLVVVSGEAAKAFAGLVIYRPFIFLFCVTCLHLTFVASFLYIFHFVLFFIRAFLCAYVCTLCNLGANMCYHWAVCQRIKLSVEMAIIFSFKILRLSY